MIGEGIQSKSVLVVKSEYKQDQDVLYMYNHVIVSHKVMVMLQL